MRPFEEKYFEVRRLGEQYSIMGSLSYYLSYFRRSIYYKIWLRQIRTYKTHGFLLDAGCGLGYFLHLAKKHFDTVGVDVSHVATHSAKKDNADIILGSVEMPSFKDAQFDVITCFDLLEHLKSPSVALAAIARLLKKNGLIIITTPNLGSIGIRIMKKRWHGFLDETHISLLPMKTWIVMLEKHGLKIRKIFSDGILFVIFRERRFHVKMKMLLRYIPHIILENISLLFFGLGLKLPPFGENLCIIAQKS